MSKVVRVVAVIIILLVLFSCVYVTYSSFKNIKSSLATMNSGNKVYISQAVVDKVNVNNKCQGMGCADYCITHKEECIIWCNSNSGVCNEVLAELGKAGVNVGFYG